jgi:predicted P-loop ATPase
MTKLDDVLNAPQAGWRKQLLVTPTCQPKPLLTNALLALRESDEWRGVLAFDEFSLATMAMKPPPWCLGANKWEPSIWADRDDVLTADWLQRQGIGVNDRVAATAVSTVAKDASFHPIKDYLGGLKWDGTPRVAAFAMAYLGAENTIYLRRVFECFLASAVARIMRPGCKADYLPILEGPQDSGKSTVCCVMFTPWFSDDLAELGSKDASMQVRCAWGIEIAELSSMNRGEIERVKAFITRKVDRFRPSYGRRVIEVPRQSVFIGTPNADTYLKDETGGRRFWPIKCGRIDLDALARDRDQLWAESVKLYRDGLSWWLTGAEELAMAREEQSARYVEDGWAAKIAEYVATKTDTAVGDILTHALFVDVAKWTQVDQNRVARCLKQVGWERYRGPAPKREWRYRKACPSTAPTGTAKWDS